MRENFANYYMWNVLLYNRETRTVIEHEDKKKSEATDMWIWRRVAKFSRTEMKINPGVLNEIREEKILSNTIRKRSRKKFGHL